MKAEYLMKYRGIWKYAYQQYNEIVVFMKYSLVVKLWNRGSNEMYIFNEAQHNNEI